MKIKNGLFISLVAIGFVVSGGTSASDDKPLVTSWGKGVAENTPWEEYPRPQMKRENWTNLNGYWRYSVVSRKSGEPGEWSGNIRVPFAIESQLSGVGQRMTNDEALWYQRDFELSLSGQRALLHFEAVDYACKVWVNDQFVGSHRGGNLPFSFDVTGAAKDGSNTVTVRVIDDTDAADRYQLRGKQTRNNEGIWYTPVSGIWQTVWVEPVPQSYVADLKVRGESDGSLMISADIRHPQEGQKLEASVSLDGSVIKRASSDQPDLSLELSDPELWSPSSPVLYDVELRLYQGDTLVDSVNSYAGFRTLGRTVDEDGHRRFTLNGKEVFHWGTLDQGWWPDGLLTPPSDEAMVSDIRFLKESGFNMIRKHKKVENRRYYYHTDRLGMLVWQDQVSGGVDSHGDKAEWPYWYEASKAYENRIDTENVEADWPDWAHEQFMQELEVMLDTLYSHPSIVMWTTFNERWGQHRTMEVGEFVLQHDPSRYLNIASGGNFFPIGHVADAHHYPEPVFLFEEPLYDPYIKVVGEFGGHGWVVPGHEWAPRGEQFAYGNMPESVEEYTQRYRRSINALGELKKRGVAAGVYTQTSDVETELNGLLTYDREVQKVLPEQLLRIHKEAGLTQ